MWHQASILWKLDQILIVNTLIHCFPFQATVRLHSCCMMTCTLNGGPDMVTEGARGDLEAGRRMPGRRWCVGVLRDGATRLMPALCPLGAAHKWLVYICDRPLDSLNVCAPGNGPHMERLVVTMKKQLCGGGLFLFRLGSFEITDSNIYILCLDVYVLCRWISERLPNIQTDMENIITCYFITKCCNLTEPLTLALY